MKGKWHLLIPACALLFQPAPIVFMRVVAWMAYSDSPWISEPAMWTASMVGLAICGAAGMLLGSLGVYMLLTRSRMMVAVALIAVCCVPALLAGAVYLRAVLVFLAVV